MSSTDTTAVEIHAWRDVWRRRHENVTNKLAAVRADARLPDIIGRYISPSESHAVERQPEPKKHAGRIALARWQVLATAVAGLGAGLMIGFAGVAHLQESPEALPLSNQASVSATVPKPLRSVLEQAGGPASVRVLGARVRATEARTALRSYKVASPRQRAHYAVSVGTYVNPATADRMKHLVRSKGYIVDVVPRGVVSQVVTPPYRTRAQAERVARGLEEIRLPAQLITRRAM